MTTEMEVLDLAIEQLSKRGGYTPNGYTVTRDGRDEGAGPDVISCCAVGGVEQAVWRLTGDDPGHAVTPNPRRRDLYARVIRKLNAKTKEMFPYSDIEELTFGATRRTTRPKMLAVFEAVRKDLS